MSRFVASVAVVLVLQACCRAEEKLDARQAAVDKGLNLLAQTQNAAGFWSFRGNQKSPAITGLALLAFLSEGHAPGKGPYGEVIRKGLEWVTQSQDERGFFRPADSSGEVYTLGICTWLLAEAVPVAEEKLAKEARQSLEKAVGLLLKGRCSRLPFKGGWRYRIPSYDADLSVTSWQLIALRAARKAGCKVPDEVFKEGMEFVLRCRPRQGGGFQYVPYSSGPSTSCTSMGLCHLLLIGEKGVESKEVKDCVAFLRKRPLRTSDSFFFSQCLFRCQALAQVDAKLRDELNKGVAAMILEQQRPDGGWIGRQEGQYGPSYATALAILALGADARRLPSMQVKK